MTERQSLVEEFADRPVATIHDLTPAEARKIMEALIARRKSSVKGTSGWDDRDGDTWIDRL